MYISNVEYLDYIPANVYLIFCWCTLYNSRCIHELLLLLLFVVCFILFCVCVFCFVLFLICFVCFCCCLLGELCLWWVFVCCWFVKSCYAHVCIFEILSSNRCQLDHYINCTLKIAIIKI